MRFSRCARNWFWKVATRAAPKNARRWAAQATAIHDYAHLDVEFERLVRGRERDKRVRRDCADGSARPPRVDASPVPACGGRVRSRWWSSHGWRGKVASRFRGPCRFFFSHHDRLVGARSIEKNGPRARVCRRRVAPTSDQGARCGLAGARVRWGGRRAWRERVDESKKTQRLTLAFRFFFAVSRPHRFPPPTRASHGRPFLDSACWPWRLWCVSCRVCVRGARCRSVCLRPPPPLARPPRLGPQTARASRIPVAGGSVGEGAARFFFFSARGEKKKPGRLVSAAPSFCSRCAQPPPPRRPPDAARGPRCRPSRRQGARAAAPGRARAEQKTRFGGLCWQKKDARRVPSPRPPPPPSAHAG